MSTGVICTIKLDPFYQQFLREHFGEFDPVFRFPKGHDLSTRFQFYLTNRKFDTPDHGSSSFKIEVPYMEHKNPFYYNQISPIFQQRFQGRIREFWRDVSHEMMGRWDREGFIKEEIIQKIVEEFEFTPDDEERIRREYKRYRKAEYNRKQYTKRKMLKTVKN